jgi:hypothetical protein
MHKRLYFIVAIISIILSIILITLKSTGNSEYFIRKVGENPNIGAISQAYRNYFIDRNRLFSPSDQQSRATNHRKYNQVQNKTMYGDAEIGALIDRLVLSVMSSNGTFNDFLKQLAQELNISYDEMLNIYARIDQVSKFDDLSMLDQKNPLIVELYLRKSTLHSLT